jgi:hypothetical protein
MLTKEAKLGEPSCAQPLALLCVRFVLFCFVFCLVGILGFELRAYTLSHSTSPVLCGYFQDMDLQTICPGWQQLNHNPPDICLLSS